MYVNDVVQLPNGVKRYRAKVGKFSYMHVTQERLALLLEIEEYDPEKDKWIPYKRYDHLWVKGNKIDTKLQGKYIIFYAKEYSYINSKLVRQYGLTIKYPDFIRKIKRPK